MARNENKGQGCFWLLIVMSVVLGLAITAVKLSVAS